MKYPQTRKAVKALILEVGIDGIYNHHINALIEQGHDSVEIFKAIDYFHYSPQTARYRGVV